jgi:hypothetical protein
MPRRDVGGPVFTLRGDGSLIDDDHAADRMFSVILNYVRSCR